MSAAIGSPAKMFCAMTSPLAPSDPAAVALVRDCLPLWIKLSRRRRATSELRREVLNEGTFKFWEIKQLEMRLSQS